MVSGYGGAHAIVTDHWSRARVNQSSSFFTLSHRDRKGEGGTEWVHRYTARDKLQQAVSSNWIGTFDEAAVRNAATFEWERVSDSLK